MALLPVVRRSLPELIAVLGALAVLAVDVAAYRPAQARMERAERAARAIGLSFDPVNQRVLLPLRVSAFVMDNSLPEAEAATAGRTGALAADLLDEMTRLAGQSGLVVTATEPGVTLQQPTEVVVRARLRARGTYGEFLRFVSASGEGQHLMSVDRFTIAAADGPDCSIELWVTRHVLKRTQAQRRNP